MTSEARRKRYWMGPARSLVLLAMLIALSIVFAIQGRDPRIVSIDTATALDDHFQSIHVTDSYAPTDTFYVSVQVEGYRGDDPLIARWRSADIPPTLTEFDGNAAGAGYVGFVLHNTAPWPEGQYTVEILYRDEVLESKVFRVEAPID